MNITTSKRISKNSATFFLENLSKSGKLYLKQGYRDIQNYRVYPCGKVQNLTTKKYLSINYKDSTNQLKQKTSRYSKVRLYLTFNKTSFQISFLHHRLVYACFNSIDKFYLYDIDHVNGDTRDNNLSNLEAISHSENINRFWNRVGCN